jgi:hypothetical protein
LCDLAEIVSFLGQLIAIRPLASSLHGWKAAKKGSLRDNPRSEHVQVEVAAEPLNVLGDICLNDRMSFAAMAPQNFQETMAAGKIPIQCRGNLERFVCG